MNFPVLGKKMLIYVLPLIIAGLWEVWLLYPQAAVEIGLSSLVVILFGLWQLTSRPIAVAQIQKQLHLKEFWRFAISPLVNVAAWFFYLLILENFFVSQLVIFIMAVTLGLLCKNIFDRFYHSANYPLGSFETISGNVNLISLFLISVIAYSFVALLQTPVWKAGLIFLIVVTLLTYQSFWISALSFRRSWIFIVILDLLLIESFWVIHFLPNTFYVKAVLIVSLFYLLVNLARNYLLTLLTKPMIIRYLTIGGLVMFLALLSAQWL